MGLAVARDRVKSPRHVVAIIGDASLGEGMALEALNHIGHLKPNLLVVLNDNRMSIAQPIGALSRYLNRLITNPTYNRLHRDLDAFINRLPHGSALLRLGRKLEESAKGLLMPGQVFEEFGLRYVGPIDGHNLPELIRTLRNVKRLKGPILLHVSTIKGKGYRLAEEDPEQFHKIEPFDLVTGRLKSAQHPGIKLRVKAAPSRSPGAQPAGGVSFSEVFSKELARLAESNRRIVAITAAMPEGTGLAAFMRRFPERCYDVGMAEQHAVGLAAGLAAGGLRPVFAVYSTFLQRAYDQIVHEVCLQRLPVVLAIDRASLVGEDGPTHHGVFDLAYLRTLPNLSVLSPKDPQELAAMLRWAFAQEGPVAIRYARGGILCGEPLGRCEPIEPGRAEALRPGTDVALVALGSLVYPALAAAQALAREGLSAQVINARFAKPIDEAMVRRAARLGRLVTLEEAQVAGGFGSAVSEALDAAGLSGVPHLRIGLPDAFVEHGKRHELIRLCGLDPASLTRRISGWCHARPAASVALPLASEPS
jgi:1-deoxy-D-xylulose-5-phosphate synthase